MYVCACMSETAMNNERQEEASVNIVDRSQDGSICMFIDVVESMGKMLDIGQSNKKSIMETHDLTGREACEVHRGPIALRRSGRSSAHTNHSGLSSSPSAPRGPPLSSL
mmetsp:Transcript_17544/g.28818  ORF Transcript_17544/g.28818 Transcript_17544/m.28818 type:complete len:109 (-) Transcript_17544:3165-3491(-)